MDAVNALKSAIDRNDLECVKALMTADPSLHQAPLGYGKSGPLTWVAECRVPWEPPSATRLAMAEWLIDNGSDVHQGGDGPLSRASLNGDRIAMMELLVRRGADVNAAWNGNFPILWSPCESVDARCIECLLRLGADPNCPAGGRGTTALDYLLSTYSRSDELRECVELLQKAGGTTRYAMPGVIETATKQAEKLAEALASEPGLAQHRFAELTIGSSGARRMDLRGATLLHAAAEFGSVECADTLAKHGADVNARADVNAEGIGGQTPIFHSVSQYEDSGLEVTRWLIGHGADLTARARVPGHYDRADEFVECTPLGFALLFPGDEFPHANRKTIALLREHGAIE
jgi:ankyrin repeat protein